MNKDALYYIAAALWGIPGVIISVKGVKAYMLMPAQSLWWLMLITVFVLVCFFFMFRGAVPDFGGTKCRFFVSCYISSSYKKW